ncbi:MAG: 50S ribosomal protein L10 [Dehalococcoidia bacterium]
MPNEAKVKEVADLAERFGRSSIVIATDFTGLSVNEVTALRKRLRDEQVEYRVVKNRLAAIAAKDSGVELIQDILEGTSGLVVGYGDPVAAAKALDGYVKETRSRMVIRKGVFEGKVLAPNQITALAALPPKNELIAKLLGQMNAPISGLVNVLTGPARGLAMVLQRRAEQLEAAG